MCQVNPNTAGSSTRSTRRSTLSPLSQVSRPAPPGRRSIVAWSPNQAARPAAVVSAAHTWPGGAATCTVRSMRSGNATAASYIATYPLLYYGNQQVASTALPRAGREVHGQAKAGRGRVIERPGVPQSSAVEQDHGARRRDDLHLVRVRAHPGRVAMLHVDRRLGAPVRTRDDAQRAAIPGERGHAPHGGQALPRPPGPAALAEVRVQALLARPRDGGAQVDAAHVPGLTQHGAGRVGEQRLPAAGSETGVGHAELRHDAGLVHVQAGLAGPGRDRRADQLVEPLPDRAEGRL